MYTAVGMPTGEWRVVFMDGRGTFVVTAFGPHPTRNPKTAAEDYAEWCHRQQTAQEREIRQKGRGE